MPDSLPNATHQIFELNGNQPFCTFVAEKLGLTATEISLTRHQAGEGTSFAHAHQQNEEVYIFLSGTGLFHIDGQEFPVQAGSFVRVAPDGKRALRADADSALVYLCIQAKANSLQQKTFQDGYKVATSCSWLPA